MKILGNFDKLEYYGCFDIYVRGVGSKQDKTGRYFLFQKNIEKAFPVACDISDKLIALSMLYGSSTNLEATQNQYFRTYKHLIPKPSDITHAYPIDLSHEAEKHKEEIEKAHVKPVFTY